MSNVQQNLDQLQNLYPNAITTNDTVDRSLTLVKQKLGLAPNQIMAADSICCDDVNTIEYPKRAYEMLGPFKMGGLDGFPFAGLTGMGAFAHHVPKDGALFVFYGPHIGFTKDETIGKIYRLGQSSASACCGAASAALGKLLSDEIIEGHITELDYQQNTLEQILLRSKDRVKSSDKPIVEATEVIYEAIAQRMDQLIEATGFPCKHIVQMGAIIINGDHDIGSFAACRSLTCLNTETKERVDWMADFAA